MRAVYHALVIKTAECYQVHIVDLGITVIAPTRRDALRDAKAATMSMIVSLLKEKLPVPRPTKPKSKVEWIVPDAKLQQALLTRWLMADVEMNISGLASALDTSWSSAQDLVLGKADVSMTRLEKIAKVLDRRVVLTFI